MKTRMRRRVWERRRQQSEKHSRGSGAGQRVRQSMVEASHVLDLLQSKQGKSEKVGEGGEESFGKTSSIGSNASTKRRQMRASTASGARSPNYSHESWS